MAEPKWKRFEKLIHQIHTQLAPEGAVVRLDDKIIGCESNVERQLDVTIRVSVAQYKILIVVECKDESRPIDVGAMGEFASLLRDVKANKGVMISSSGYTPAAVDMARAQGIDARTYLNTESVDWKSEVKIPVLLTRVKLDAWNVRFSQRPRFPMGSTDEHPFPARRDVSPRMAPLSAPSLHCSARYGTTAEASTNQDNIRFCLLSTFSSK